MRNGCFCAHPYLLHLLGVDDESAQAHQDAIVGGSKALLPGLVRASFGCYNTLEEVDHFTDMLAKVVAGDYQGNYVQDPVSGAYWPEGYDPQPEAFFKLG